jgi:hypothetical protein
VTSDLTLRQHALRVAALDALVEAAKKEYNSARADAQEAFKGARADGQSQQRVLLPSGEDIGLISIKDGTVSSDVTEVILKAWCREHLPGAIEEFIDPACLSSADVIAAVKAAVPGAVRQRVRPGTADELVKEIVKSGGWLVDKETSEKVRVAEVTKNDPTGAFAFAGGGSDQRRRRIVEEWQAGRLGEIGFGPAAITGGDSGE